MMAPRRARATHGKPRDPQSAGQLEKLVRAWAREHQLAEKRVRDWVSCMAIGGALTRTSGESPQAPFSIKGGIALELRRPGMVRATRDLDLTYHGQHVDMTMALEDALAPFGRFRFQRSGQPLQMERTATVRVEVGVRFDGSTWGSVPLDINRSDGSSAEIEMVRALDLRSRFGIDGPRELPCLSLRYHLAHKLHSVTRPDTADHPNDRVQDLVDLLLFRGELTDSLRVGALRSACIETFAARATHRWPPLLSPPGRWVEPFARLAREVGVGPEGLEEAVEIVRAAFAAIDSHMA